jgi:hypothetical protein
MCTVTFVPKAGGYLLAMNRDDAYSRVAANIPSTLQCNDVTAIYPSESSGGTWISVNDARLAFALLNWNRPTSSPKNRSRGEIIRSLANFVKLDRVAESLEHASLDGINPFRLICFSGRDQQIREWRWNGVFSTIDHTWEYRHWFSSGLSDDEALARRSAICNAALSDSDALSVKWIRRLHSSHEADRGAFGICVHRDTGGTLSYTEIEVSAVKATMLYRTGSPCSDAPGSTSSIPLLKTPDQLA